MVEFIFKIQTNLQIFMAILWIAFGICILILSAEYNDTVEKLTNEHRKILIVISAMLFVAAFIVTNIYVYLY